MSDYQRERVLDWLRRLRGSQSQESFAAAVSEQTGWNITRDRYSKYESGALPFGGAVLQHFIDYAESVGAEPPDMTPPAPVLSLEERAVIAAERQADAMEMHVRLLARQTIATEAIATRQGAKLPTGPALTELEDEILASVRSALAGMPSLGRGAGPLPAGEG